MALLKVSIKVDGVLYKSHRDDVPEEIITLHQFENLIVKDGKATSKKSKKGSKSDSEGSEDS